MITLEQIQEAFPEARPTMSSGQLEYYVNCPKFHKKGGRYKMTINAETGWFLCHDCLYKGNAHDLYLNQLPEMLSRLRVSKEGLKCTPVHRYTDVPTFTAKPGEILWGKNKIRAPGETKHVSELDSNHPACVYLNSRGFNPKDHGSTGEFPILYCTKGYFVSMGGHCTTQGRLVFPVVMNDDIVGWQARYIDFKLADEKTGEVCRYVWRDPKFVKITKNADGEWRDHHIPKYYTCPGMQRSSTLYNFDGARKTKLVVAVEGPLDAVRVGPEAVATFGKMITSQQRKLLKTYWDSIILIRDEDVDPDSQNFQEIVGDLSICGVIHFKMKGYKDPGDAPRTEIWNQVADTLKVKRLDPVPAGKN
jgi:hypothetical protein